MIISQQNISHTILLLIIYGFVSKILRFSNFLKNTEFYKTFEKCLGIYDNFPVVFQCRILSPTVMKNPSPFENPSDNRSEPQKSMLTATSDG